MIFINSEQSVLLHVILTVQTSVPLPSVWLGCRARFGTLPSAPRPLLPSRGSNKVKETLACGMRPKIYVGHEMCESPEEVLPDSPMKLDTVLLAYSDTLGTMLHYKQVSLYKHTF